MSSDIANPHFPAGLRVLVVDDDPLCLRIVEKMLKRCQYEGAAKSFSFTRRSFLSCEGNRTRDPSEGGAANQRGARARRGEARNARRHGRSAGSDRPARTRAVAATAVRRSATAEPATSQLPLVVSRYRRSTWRPVDFRCAFFVFHKIFLSSHIGNDQDGFFQTPRLPRRADLTRFPHTSLPFTNSSDHLHARRGRAENPARA